MGLGGKPVAATGTTVQTALAPNQDAVVAAVSSELQDKGFLVTSLDGILNWARTGSLWPMSFSLSGCRAETG